MRSPVDSLCRAPYSLRMARREKRAGRAGGSNKLLVVALVVMTGVAGFFGGLEYRSYQIRKEMRKALEAYDAFLGEMPKKYRPKTEPDYIRAMREGAGVK